MSRLPRRQAIALNDALREKRIDRQDVRAVTLVRAPMNTEAVRCACECGCERTLGYSRHRLCYPCWSEIKNSGKDWHVDRVEQARRACKECGGKLVVNQYRVVVCSACGEADRILP